MGRDPVRLRHDGVRFVKMLGTARGFGVSRSDPTRWAAITVTDGEPPGFPHWARIATAACRLDLLPLSSRGTWAGQQPFTATHAQQAAASHAQQTAASHAQAEGRGRNVLVLTRARLRASRAVSFWRAIGPVAAALADGGPLAAFGIGEAPIGWQGTVSVWRDSADLVGFAYRHPEHRRVIERTSTTGWYAEELFARFAVTAVVGDPAVVGWTGVEKERLSG
jgi:hypothetical protein